MLSWLACQLRHSLFVLGELIAPRLQSRGSGFTSNEARDMTNVTKETYGSQSDAIGTPASQRPSGVVDSPTLRLGIIYRDPRELQPAPRNARTHSSKQIHQIAASLRQFGFNNPVLLDSEDRVLCGHGRVEAARLIGLFAIPTIRLDHLKEPERRAYMLADNQLATLAQWDPELLKIELGELTVLDIPFDVEITGFSTAEINVIIDGEPTKAKEEGDGFDPAELDTDDPVASRLGDLWLLGDHRLLCANALEGASFERLMSEDRADIVFADAPYNVKIDGHVGGLGKITHSEFAMASGEMSEAEFTRFLTTVFEHFRDWSRNGSIHFQCIDWRHFTEMLAAGKTACTEVKNVCCWAKTNAGMGSLYRSQTEFVFVFKSGTAPHTNNIELGKFGRYRSNLWTYAGVNTFRAGRKEELESHPTVKPLALVQDAIKDVSRKGDIVLDGFGGSGTTLIAAEKTKRCARLLELEPKYVDVAIRRWEKLTGLAARHADLDLTFAEVMAQRAFHHGEAAASSDPALTPVAASTRIAPVRVRTRPPSLKSVA